VRGKRPVLALVVAIRAGLLALPQGRSCGPGFWSPESWPSTEEMPSVAALTKAVQDTPETLDELEAYYAVPKLLVPAVLKPAGSGPTGPGS